MARKTAEIDEIMEEEEQLDPLTVAVPKKAEEKKGPTVPIFLPEIMGAGDGIKVDQYEHVTIANETGEKIWHVHRGETVEVPVEVFIALKARYPKL